MIREKNKVYRAFISILATLLLLINTANITVYAQSNIEEVQRVTNSFVQYSVATDNGRFSIKTDEGLPHKEDEKKKLLFEENKPETSFTTFKIDGEEYIYGNKYGFLNLGGTFLNQPQVNGKQNNSTWVIGNIHITQRLELIEDPDNPNVGNVRITYVVDNKDTSSKQIGARMLLDTMLGSNDGSPITVAGSQEPITNESRIVGEDIPQYWRSTDNLFMPTVISYGFTQGWGNLSPSEMVIGHWNGLSQSKWEYQPDENLNFTKTDNKYGSADSAVALYWDPITLKPGEKKVFETYYGIGNFQNVNDGAKFSLNLNAPEKLVLNDNKTGYVEDTFEVIAEIDNTLVDASNLTNVTASLILEEGLTLVDGEIPYISADLIKKNEMYTFKWRVRANNSNSYTSKQFRVDISSDNSTEPVSNGGYVIIPGVSGEPPVIQFQNITPKKLFYQGMKSFTIKGKGYDVYMNKNRWKMLLINDQTNESLQIPRDNIIVKEDSITVTIDNNLEKGYYSLEIQHDDFDDESIPYKLEMTDDIRFKSRSYGVLYIKKEKSNGEWKYTLETAESEESLKEIEKNLSDDEEVVLNIKGDIRVTEENGQNVYRAYTENEQTVINSVLQYSGQPLEIRKVDDTAAVSGLDTIAMAGNGKLTLENGFTFWWWDFEINITDGENYVTEFAEEDDDETNIEVEFTGIGSVLKWVAGFAIELENAVILKEGVSFGGSMELSFLPGAKNKKSDKGDSSDSDEVSGADLRRLFGEEEYESDDSDDDEEEDGGIKADISKVLFGNKANSFGFIGIDSESQIKAPKDTIPISWIQDGFEATLVINTIEDIYGLEAEVNIKIVEAYVNLTFMKNQSTGNYLPDDIVLAGGYDPGVPVGPTGVFITKVGGGVEDLYGTLTGDSSLPPLQVILMTSVDFAKVIELDAKLSVSKNGFVLEGEGEIAKIKALKEVRVGIRWARPVHFDFEAKLSLFDMIEGGISLYISEEEWEGIVKATVSVPDGIFLIGGQELLGAELGANNKKIWGTVSIIRIPVGITYYWGKGVDYNIASAAGNIPYRNNGMYSTTLIEEDGDHMVMVVGSNIKRIGSSTRNYYASLELNYEKSLVVASLGNQEHYMNIQNQDLALLEFKYSGDTPDIQVYKPNGTEYPLISVDEDAENANMILQEIQPESSSTGELEKYIYISILQPEDGQWRIVSDKPIESSLMDVEPAPRLNSVSTNKLNTNEYRVNWDAEYQQDTIVDIYLAKNQSEAGIQLAEDVDGALGQYNVVIPDGVEDGDYYIRATIEKSDFGYDSMYTQETIHIIDPYKPSEVTNIEVQAYGDGLLKATWNGVSEEGVDGYIITVYDGNGNVVDSIGHQFASPEEEEILLGGQYRLQDSTEIGGLKPGEEYKIGIVTSKKRETGENYSTHYSDSSYSGKVYLPTPDPANINIQFDDSFTDGYNNEGELTKISNKEAVTLFFSSNQSDISTDVYINGVLYKRASGNGFEVNIPTADGSYSVEFITVNKDGDTSSKTVNYTIDRTAPILMVDSPKQGQVSENGQILVKGIGEKSTTITVNGLSVSTNSEGVFEKNIPIGDNLKQNIVIEARDKANNVTRYETDVVNDTVKIIDKISIRPVIEEIYQGESLTFEAIAVDDKGREILLNDGVEWSLLTGQSLAEVDQEGKLETFSNGELLLKAAYYISEDYSFEDAISIKVLPKVDNVIEDKPPVVNGNNNNRGIDRELERILENIIKMVQNITIVNTFDINQNESKTVLLSNGARLNIPSNSIGERDKLLVGTVEDINQYLAENDQNRKLQSPIYELQFAMSNNSFSKPLELVVNYDESKIKNPENLGVYYFNENFGKWQYIGGAIDKNTKEVKANINHFSKYALIEDSLMLQFMDTKGRWSEKHIKGLYSLGVVNGIKDGNGYKYEPRRNITRLEFTKLVVETLMNTGEIMDKGDTALAFADKALIPSWGKKYAALAFENDIIKGRATGSGFAFDGNTPITRAEAATIIGRTLDNMGNTKNDFIDKNQLPSWAKTYVGALWNQKIINGYPDNSFKPNNNITREEAASMIANWIY